MKNFGFTAAKGVAILEKLEAGASATALGRRHGDHLNTIGTWKPRHHGLDTSDVSRIKTLEAEHSQMQRIIA